MILKMLNSTKHSFQTSLTNLGSFLEQGHHNRCVPAAHRPVQRTHAAVVYVLYHGPVVDQELDLEGKKKMECQDELRNTVDNKRIKKVFLESSSIRTTSESP